MSSQVSDYSWSSVRKNIIKSAVEYIINPNSLAFTVLENSKFLLEKGLTDEEVDLVLSIGNQFKSNTNPPKAIKEIIIEKECNSLVALLSGSLASNKSLTGRIFNLTLTAATWSALLYGLYKFYETFILDIDRNSVNINMQETIQQMNQEIHVLRAKMSDLVKTVNTLNEFTTKYLGKRNESLLILKKELNSIQSLLVNRSLFADIPRIPETTPKRTEKSPSRMTPNSLSDGSTASTESLEQSSTQNP